MKKFLLPVLFLVGASFLVLSSISKDIFYLQLLWVVLGLAIFFVLRKIDWRFILNYRWLIWGLYALTVILLIVVYLQGPVIRGTKSWLSFGWFHFQPVELAKISLILFYAEYFSRRHLGIARFKNILTSFFIFALPAGLTLIQPDLGSTIVLFGIWLGFLLVSGLPLRRIFLALFIFAIIGLIGWFYFLKDYQKARIIGVFYPEKEILGINYSAYQSKIAIGSAGFFGKGYKQGTETQLGFLTEPATDFTLAALIEEWGLLGGFAAVVAILILIFNILRTGILSERNFEKFVCLGGAMVFGFHFFLNAGSTSGIMPVVGITFPFLSYGGSSILTNFFILGIINSIAGKK